MQPVLTIDLTTGKTDSFNIPAEWERSYLGGASLAARLLYDRLTAELDPLSPAAALLFMTGPLTGTGGPAVGRFVICGRSPATGLWGESNCGGFWGPELRRAGYDGLLVTGQAAEPVYLWLQDGRCELRPANHLWGLDTYQTQAALQAELDQPHTRVAAIGPAGELGIPFALILCDHGRVAGRTGMGALMGSKRLKAVAVQGSSQPPVVELEQYLPLRKQINRELHSDTFSQLLRTLGTAGGAEYFDYLGTLPKRYYSAAVSSEPLQISGANISETILVGAKSCHACVIACGREVRLADGARRKGPEYETLAGFGPNLGLNDPAVATRLGELCDRYGMDTISLSNTIGLALALWQQGVVTGQDTGGLALRWGDAAAVEQLVHLTARRAGFGAFIAEGARALGRRFGAAEQAVQVNGLELPYHDPRSATGMALVYATSPRGACHNQSDYFLVDIGQVDPDLGLQFYSPLGGAEKAANVARHQDWRTVFNALVMCLFANLPPQAVAALINAACGLDWSVGDLLAAGERSWNLKRVINIRLGLRQHDDRLPPALLAPRPDEPTPGPSLGERFEPMLLAYYAARGWDPATGFPTPSKLRDLNLEWVIPDLYGE